MNTMLQPVTLPNTPAAMAADTRHSVPANHRLLTRIIELKRHDDERDQRIRLLRNSRKVYVTHKYREDGRAITHVRCWTRPRGERYFVSDIYEVEEILAALDTGKCKIYTAGLEKANGKPFDFWLLCEKGAEVRRVVDHIQTARELDRIYNNLEELAEIEEQITATYKFPWTNE